MKPYYIACALLLTAVISLSIWVWSVPIPDVKPYPSHIGLIAPGDSIEWIVEHSEIKR